MVQNHPLENIVKLRESGDVRLSPTEILMKSMVKDTVRLHIPLTDPHSMPQIVGELRTLATIIEQTWGCTAIGEWSRMSQIYGACRGWDSVVAGVPLSVRLGKGELTHKDD